MGFFDCLKGNSDNDRMRKIRESGRFGEDQFRNENAFSDIKRRHHGRDFDKPVRDSRGRTRIEKWEVKRNNSPLSEKQKKTRGLKVRRYVDTKYGFVEGRTEDKNGNRLEQDVFTGKWKKAKKQDNFSNMFGSSSSEPRRSRNNNFGFGSGSGLNDMFGTGSSRKRRSSSGWGF
jgi:hypothetical protein